MDMGEIKPLQVPIFRDPNSSCVLFVGVGTNLKDFIHLLLTKLPPYESLNVQVHVTHKLPLFIEVDSRGNKHTTCSVDLIVFLIDCCNQNSIVEAKEAVNKFVPTDFFLGRVLFIASNFSKQEDLCIEMEDVIQLATDCNSVVLWDDINKENEYLAQQILGHLDFLRCKSPYTPPMLFTGLHNVTPTQ